MALLTVGIGDCRVSASAEDTIVTYALGSCIGVMMHDPVARVGGLLHILMPDSRLDPAKAASNPLLFADTGLSCLLEQCAKKGAVKSRTVVHLAGGSQMSTGGGLMNIGLKNLRAIHQGLAKEHMRVAGESVGGRVARTVRIKVASGEIEIQQVGASAALSTLRSGNIASGH